MPRVTMPVIADVRPGGTRYYVDNLELAFSAAANPVPTAEGSLVVSDAALLYAELLHPLAANYTLQTTATNVNWVNAILKEVTQDSGYTGLNVVNPNVGTGAFGAVTVANTSGGGYANSLNLITTGAGNTGWTGADRALVGAGSALSGGLLLATEGVTPIAAMVDGGSGGSQVEGWRLSTTEFVVNEGSVDLDFRVEGNGQANLLFADAGNDVVGIRSISPSSVAEGLHVPWITGDADATAQFGSANASNDQNAIETFSYSGLGCFGASVTSSGLFGSSVSGIGVQGSSVSGAGASFSSGTDIGLVVNLTGAGTAIADFNDNGISILTVQDGGQSDFSEYIRHLADTDTSMRFQADQWTLACGGVTMIDAVEGASDYVNLFPSGSGKVGVGTTTPTETVNFHEPSSGRFYLKFSNSTTGQVALTDGFDIGLASTEAVILNNRENTDMVFYTNAVPRMYIKSDGRVGVPTSAPAAKLHIDQSGTGSAIPVLSLDQADVSEEMINFIVAATGAGNPVDTATAVGATYARLRVAVNGTFKYIQLYDA